MVVSARTFQVLVGVHKSTDGSLSSLNNQVTVLIPAQLMLILVKLVKIQLAFPLLMAGLRLVLLG